MLSACSVTQSCLILCDPMNYSAPGSSVQGIFQMYILLLHRKNQYSEDFNSRFHDFNGKCWLLIGYIVKVIKIK